MTVPARSAAPVALTGRVQGALEVVRPDRVAGWALDRADRSVAVEVDVIREGRKVATVKADRARKDLSGAHGFIVMLDPPLEPGFEFTVTAVARAADGARADLRRAGSDERTPDRRLLERVFDEVARLRQEEDDGTVLRDALQRFEVAQARFEAALAGIEPPAPASQAGLRVLVVLALAAGVGSLAIGIGSMLWP